jgi:hypothetical protein
VIRERDRSDARADFAVRQYGKELLAETKWYADPARKFSGRTLRI